MRQEHLWFVHAIIQQTRFRTSFLTLMPLGLANSQLLLPRPAQVCFLDEVQALLSCVVQLARGGVSPLALEP